MPKFVTGGQLPEYVNNARVQVTSDNVYIDFGVADPFEAPEGEEPESAVRARVVMNKSTFLTFLDHLNGLKGEVRKKKTEGELPVTIMSRCPPHIPVEK